jgi:hypothetical protein
MGLKEWVLEQRFAADPFGNLQDDFSDRALTPRFNEISSPSLFSQFILTVHTHCLLVVNPS